MANKNPRILYIGKNHVVKSIKVFKRLAEEFEVVGVVTIPAKMSAKARNKVLGWGSVEDIAKRNNIPVIKTRKIDDGTKDFVRSKKPDIIISNSNPLFVPDDVIKMSNIAAIGCHPSLLPRNRGKHGVMGHLKAGDDKAGCTVFHLTKEVDEGDIVRQIDVPIYWWDNTLTVTRRMNRKIPSMVVNAVKDLSSGKKSARQDHSKATYSNERVGIIKLYIFRLKNFIRRNRHEKHAS